MTLNLTEEPILASLDARTSPHSCDTNRDGIASRDLSRYYALIEADLRTLRSKLTSGEKAAIIASIQNASRLQGAECRPLYHTIEDTIKYERLTEHHDVDGLRLLEKVASLSRSENFALTDAAGRWWHANGAGENPALDDLFVGLPKPK